MNPKNIIKLGKLLSRYEIPRYVMLQHITNNITSILQFLKSSSFVPSRELATLYLLETSCSEKNITDISEADISDCLKYYKSNIEEFFNTRKSIILDKLIDILFTEVYGTYANGHIVNISYYSKPKIPLGYIEIIEGIVDILKGNKPISSLASIEVLYRDIVTDVADNITRNQDSYYINNNINNNLITENLVELKTLLKKYAYVHIKDTHDLSIDVVIKILEILFWENKDTTYNINVKTFQYILRKEYNGLCNFPVLTPYKKDITSEEIITCDNPIRLLLSIDSKAIPQERKNILGILVYIIFIDMLNIITPNNCNSLECIAPPQ